MRATTLAYLLFIPALAGCVGDLPIGPVGRIEPTDYLRDDRFTEWVIEIDYVQGQRPRADALNTLQDRLEDLARKDSIKIVLDDSLPETNRDWNIESLLDYKRQHQDFHSEGDRIVTWVAYVDGEWPGSGNGNVLGVALSDHETVAIMKEDIDSAGFLFVSAADVERTVLVHEFGHIIGLVDNGIPMQTPHGDGTGHSDNSNSVMWAAVETFNGANQLRGAPPDTFDADDKRDVCAAGGWC